MRIFKYSCDILENSSETCDNVGAIWLGYKFTRVNNIKKQGLHNSHLDIQSLMAENKRYGWGWVRMTLSQATQIHVSQMQPALKWPYPTSLTLIGKLKEQI